MYSIWYLKEINIWKERCNAKSQDIRKLLKSGVKIKEREETVQWVTDNDRGSSKLETNR